MTKRRFYIVEFLFCLCDFFVIASLGMLGYFLVTNRLDGVFNIYFLFIPFLLMFAIRKYLVKIYLFFPANLLVVATVFLLSESLLQKILFTIVAFALFIASLYYRMNGIKATMGLLISRAVAIVAITILFKNELMYFFCAVAVVITVMYIFMIHIQNMDETVSIFPKTAAQPLKNIVSHNNLMITIFVFIALFGLSLIAYSRVFDYLYYFLLFLYNKYRQSINLSQSSPIMSPEERIDEMPRQQENPFAGMFPPSEPSRFYDMLTYVLVGITAVVIVTVIVNIVKSFISRFNESKPSDDFKEFLGFNLFKSNINERMNVLSQYAPSNKIRRQYYKKVQDCINKGVKINNFNTPNEIKSKISDLEDISELTELYKDARYSNAARH